MHPELEDLVTRSLTLAKRKLREDGEIPVFGSVLDSSGKPLLLAPEYEEGAEPIRMSVPGLVELLREMIRQSETSGAAICAPAIVPMTSGETFDGLKIHADHAFDPHAYYLVVPFARVEAEFQFGPPGREHTDDLLVARAP